MLNPREQLSRIKRNLDAATAAANETHPGTDKVAKRNAMLRPHEERAEEELRVLREQFTPEAWLLIWESLEDANPRMVPVVDAAYHPDYLAIDPVRWYVTRNIEGKLGVVGRRYAQNRFFPRFFPEATQLDGKYYCMYFREVLAQQAMGKPPKLAS